MKRVESNVYDSTRRYELIVYAILWLLVLILPFVNEFIKFIDGKNFSWSSIARWFIGLIPFIPTFLVNNFILVPRFLWRNRIRTYLVFLFMLIIAFIGFLDISYEYKIELMNMIKQHLAEGVINKPRKIVFFGMTMPIVLNLSLLLLMMSINALVVMVFKYIREKEDRRSIENIHLQDELRFLKAQINPHFFMNMLNGIHAMIELDQLKAQELTIELSRMMRYILYEGESQSTKFSDEVRFIISYVSLMRQRYPESKVKICLNVPETPSEEFILPPLLFVTFVENAFKHGVSYSKPSIIEISLSEIDSKVEFSCVNTRQDLSAMTGKGIGLQNVRRRLDLLYGDRYSLFIDENDDLYKVKLIIPSL